MIRNGRAEDIISVSIIEDDDEIRDALALLVGESPGFVLLSVFPACEPAITDLPGNSPDVLLMDIALPGMSGIEGVSHIKRLLPTVDIIMLTVHKDDDLVFQSLCAGATGYLLKTTPPAKIMEAIREVRTGGAPMSAAIARKIVDSFRRTSSPLTDRESEVLVLLCKGHSYKMIADELFISEQTVHFHIRNIYQKLQVHSKSEAVAKAIRQRLV
jgi:DNA-binding NarL/FixJ family response regulator